MYREFRNSYATFEHCTVDTGTLNIPVNDVGSARSAKKVLAKPLHESKYKPIQTAKHAPKAKITRVVP